MSNRIRLSSVLALPMGLAVAAQLWAFPESARQTKRACVACHSNPAGGAELTDAGKAYATKKKVPAEAIGRKADYVGSARCGSCHTRLHQAWSETAHGRALANLMTADSSAIASMAGRLEVKLERPPAQSDGCVTCHVTGFHLPGGYPAADSALNVSLAAVGCESCHGPGGLHVYAPFVEKKTVIRRAVSAKLCTQCHTPQTHPDFKFEDMVMKGAHPRKEG